MLENYKHISEIKEKFQGCKTLDEINDVIRTIPGIFGRFGVELERRNGQRIAVITNVYYDSNLDDYNDDVIEVEL